MGKAVGEMFPKNHISGLLREIASSGVARDGVKPPTATMRVLELYATITGSVWKKQGKEEKENANHGILGGKIPYYKLCILKF